MMTLCLVSATDSYNVTLSRMSVLASPLGSALTKNAPAKRLESALANSLDLKSSEMNTCRKCGGLPPTLHFAFYNLRLRIGVHQCSSEVTPLAFFCLPPLLPLPSLQAMATDSPCATVRAGWQRQRGLGGHAAIGLNRQQDGGVQARLHRCAIMLWAMHCGCGGHEL